MKRFFWAAATLAVGVTFAHATPARDFNYATFVPPASENNTLALEPAFKSIKEKTDGKVNIKLFAGGQLLGAKEMLSGVRDGLADLGFVVPVYAPSSMPNAVVIADMMPYGRDPVAVAGAMLETQLLDCSSCQKDYSDNNLVYLGGHVPTAYRLLCADKVSSKEDLQGLRMRGGSAAMTRIAEELGGTPINMSAGDMYEAMARGQLDCVVGPIAWLRQYSLGEVVKSVIGEPLGVLGGLGLVTWNADSWNALTGEQKQVVIKEMPGIAARATVSGYMADDAEVRKKYKDSVDFVDSVPEIRKSLDKINERALPSILKHAKERGATDPKAIADTYLKNLKKWRKISKERIHGDADALAQALWDEVYSKVKF